MVTLFINIEGAFVGLSPAVKNFLQSKREGHLFCTTESGFELGSGISTYTYYIGKGLANLAVIWGIFSDHIPDIISIVGRALDSIPFAEALSGVALVTNIARWVKESLSLARQNIFLSIFKRHAWQGTNIRNALAEIIDNFDKAEFRNSLPLKFRNIVSDKKEQLQGILKGVDAGDQDAQQAAEKILADWTGRNIRNCLEEINNLPTVELERAIPVWLYADIVAKGGRHYLNTLLKKVYKGEPKAAIEATKLLDNMRSYASKKRIIHILTIIGSIVNALLCVGFFIACPMALTIVFIALIIIFAASNYLVDSGYVENREGGFSLKICIPKGIRDMPTAIMSIPGKITALMLSKTAKKQVPSSHQIFTRLRLAKETMPSQALKIRNYSRERLERQSRLRARGLCLPTSAA
jgi:hypothetical protein